ncbi:60S ribosomal protein L18a-like protein isoform X1 [Selaginella moellendorffii]|uniref:60S ribosomal protein L18a-like protein isoform X1 n=1 Tax=Selaginella moellendorffii TaxID=88036 RepID=UPI000D1C5CA2|nr:60S ribosomal protein L18a-like protein isoform X1 [Selaginella moellendorffii]|eukprot:XP_024525180.1 60S ribosomal protein L18a-like protein isoform X1 [Selaginella moellendorffii]
MAIEAPAIQDFDPQHHQHYGTFSPLDPARRSSQYPGSLPVAIAEGRALYASRIVREEEPPLPLCNIGIGWFLFAIGFVSIIPWFVGAIIFACFTHDWRERAGLAACTVAAFVTILVGGSRFL